MGDVQWERAACPVCGGDDGDEFLRAPGDGAEYRLARCRGCATVFTSPRPVAACAARFYPADYAPYQPRARRTRGARSLADAVPVPPGSRLLDYGCGSGRFAARMRDRGWAVTGMDFSAHAAEAARRAYGLTVVHGALPHPAVPPASFDAVTMREVVEHLYDPGAVLRAAHAALAPGGHLYVSVPNLAGWGFRAFGRAWSALDLPRHLTHFTPESLGRLLTDCGFVVGATRTRGHAKWTANSVARARDLNPRWWTGAARLRLVRGALNTWGEWRGTADSLCVLARKPAAGASAEPLRRAA